MVSVDLLEALDALLWLRTGHHAGGYLGCTQSTVSRKSRRCLQTFQLQMVRRGGEWQLQGDCELIDLERHVHQALRWQQARALRLDAQHWCAHLLPPAEALPSWRCGNLNYADYDRPLQLLRLGVIDAWISSAPDVLQLVEQHRDLCAQPLITAALWPVVKPGHPLLARGAAIQFQDLRDYPLLPLPEDAFPIAQRCLKQLDLWPTAERQQRLSQAGWVGQVPLEDMAIGLENTLRLASGVAGDWQPLPLPLPLTVGDVLLVRREFVDAGPLQSLLAQLRSRAAQLAAAVPRWCDPMPPLVVHQPGSAVAAEGTKVSATPLLQ